LPKTFEISQTRLKQQYVLYEYFEISSELILKISQQAENKWKKLSETGTTIFFYLFSLTKHN